MSWLFRLLWALALTTPALAQSNDALSELDETLSALIAEHPTPGMALVIVEDGEIVLQKGYGLRSIDPPLPMTDQTLLSPGSLSKNLTALGVLRLVEQGKLDLNAPISEIAPQVKLDNPFDTPITLAMLLEHSAGLEGSNFAEYAFSQPGFNPADYAARMAGRVTVSWPPGYFFSYANGGHTFAALAIEKACGCSYDSFMQREILTPLGMVDSSFLIVDIDQARLSKSYDADGRTPAARWRMAIRPSGALLSTIADLGKLVQFYATRGSDYPGFVSAKLLQRMEDSATTATSRMGLIEGTYGLGNFGSFAGPGYIVHGHAGSTEGFRTWLAYDPDTARGYAFVLNARAGLRGQLVKQLGNYMTRDYPPVQPMPTVEDRRLTQMRGWYEPITHDMLLRRWMWRVAGAVQLTPSVDRLTIDPVVPTQANTPLLAVGGGKLRRENRPIPTAAIVDGPAGEPVLVDGDAYQPVNGFIAVGRFYGLCAALVVAGLASLHGSVSLPRRMLSGTPQHAALRLRAGLFFAGASLLLLLGVFIQKGMLGGLDSAAKLGRVSVWSVLLCGLSISGPVGIGLAGTAYRAGAQSRLEKLYGLTALLSLGFAWLYLGIQGWVPLVTWRI